MFATVPRAVGFSIVLGGRVVTMQTTTWSRANVQACSGSCVSTLHRSSPPRGYRPGHNLGGTAVVLENASKSLSRHDGASVSRACRQRCDELVADATRTMSSRTSVALGGRPGLRFLLPSYLAAMR